MKLSLKTLHHEMKESFAEVNQRVDNVVLMLSRHVKESDFHFRQIDERFEQVDRRFEQVDRRFEQVDRRFDHIDGQFAQVDDRFTRLTNDILAAFAIYSGTVEKMLQHHDERIVKLEEKVES